MEPSIIINIFYPILLKAEKSEMQNLIIKIKTQWW